MKAKTTITQIGEAQRSTQGTRLVTHVPLQIRKRGTRKVLIAPTAASVSSAPELARADAPLVIALGRAFYWQHLIDDGEIADADALAKRHKLDRTVVKETLRFTLLAPDIVQAILDGTQPRTFSLQEMRQRVPADWQEQRQRWGFTQQTSSKVSCL